MAYGAFLDQLVAGNIASVTFQGTAINGHFERPLDAAIAAQRNSFTSRVPDFGDPELISKLRKQSVAIDVGPSNTEPTELLAAVSAAIEHDNASVRLVLIPFANLAETTAALDARQADLDVVRTDLFFQVGHASAPMVLARARRHFSFFSDARIHPLPSRDGGVGDAHPEP